MKKTILVLTVLSLAAVFTACRSNGEQTTEERLRSIYGWKGESLPAPNPDQTEVAVTETVSVEEVSKEKDAGIVSTVTVTETVTSDVAKADEKKPDKADKSEAESGPVKKDNAPVKAPSIAETKSEKKACELSGETKTYIVKQGESLWAIAAKEYNSGYKWGIIYRANKELLKDKPDSIRPGMKLVIPLLKQKTSAVPAKTPEKQAAAPAEKTGKDAADKPATAAPVIKTDKLPSVPAAPVEPGKAVSSGNEAAGTQTPAAK